MDGRALLARRRLGGLAVAATALGAASRTLAKPVLLNPCRAAMTPELAASPWLAQVRQGRDPQQIWDGHVHLAGVGGGAHAPAVDNFALFARTMDERRRGLLFGDVSAIMLRNRSLAVIKTRLRRPDWHDRLLNGSDRPIPGILPPIAPAVLVRAGLLPKGAVDDLVRLREHNPLRLDPALKRPVRWRGHRFAASVGHTRSFFQNHA